MKGLERRQSPHLARFDMNSADVLDCGFGSSHKHPVRARDISTAAIRVFIII